MYVTIPSVTAPDLPLITLPDRGPHHAAFTLKAGRFLFRAGDTARLIYYVHSGVLRLTRVFEDGRRQVIAFGYPGDVVGFPVDGLHHTDCDAVTEARLQPYRRSALETGTGDPELHRHLLTAALHEIGAMQDHFMMLGRKSATERVASFLCVLKERVGQSIGSYDQVALPMSRADIADFLGLTTETVSRTFTLLRKSKVIALHQVHTVIIRQPERLTALAQGEDRLTPPKRARAPISAVA
ncbi:helix-turn-helix domain-containing protein [Aestuariivita sp.]|jgi:CRP/FNR family transcriptional regulator|uniref:helix-turn-helix domain-containing protein n=1 Tax=Aestuariivita sp. TaxID=1872407 RepID=UPI00216D1434|nr:helix-turn-helix domain-containing protein [Aestuariivita sp.]MCE8005953.1 helix-turn-helix domain-containing protein [Aestuariivita sp.]